DGDGRTVLAPHVHSKTNCANMSRVGAVQRKNMKRSALLTVLVLAFFGTLLCSPVSQQSAQAQMFGGLKASAADGGNLVTLVRRGGGGRGHVAHRAAAGRCMPIAVVAGRCMPIEAEASSMAMAAPGVTRTIAVITITSGATPIMVRIAGMATT